MSSRPLSSRTREIYYGFTFPLTTHLLPHQGPIPRWGFPDLLLSVRTEERVYNVKGSDGTGRCGGRTGIWDRPSVFIDL